MNPLRVALVHYKKRSGCGGRWAYRVNEFNVHHYPLEKQSELNVSELSKSNDVIIQEDRRLRTSYIGRGIPRLYHVRGGTCRWPHSYWHRHELARGFDAVLVDALPLSFFEDLGMPIVRFNYCVNDKLYRDYGLEKTVDVSCHMSFDSKERKVLAFWLRTYCEKRGYSHDIRRVSPHTEYAKAFNRSKVTVNLAKPRDRNYRLFDAMACRTCVLTSPMPTVSGERRVAGVHYLEWRDLNELADLIDETLLTERWREVGDAAHALMHEHHTWRVRASELRGALAKELGL